LAQVRVHRGRHRLQRRRAGIPVVALVGYTNAGKSTLLRALSDADVYIADQLFATLDPLTRSVDLPSGRQVVVTDTVGFLQKLPTTLIAAFRATLEEIAEANLLLHVVDTAHPNVLEQIETVEDTLAQIEVPPIPRILVWNKMDIWGEQPLPKRIGGEYYDSEVRISARTGSSVDDLLMTVESVLASTLRRVRLLLPYQHGEIVSYLHESSIVEKQEHTEDGVIMTVQLSPSLVERFREYEV
jgi:GTP-binding protein HflX